MHHVEIINTLIRKYGYATYLEIGVHIKSNCFNHIIAKFKTSVDPGVEDAHETYDYKMESDDFFDAVRAGITKFPPGMKWDCIFIDGLHTAEQVHRDIINSLEHLSEGGTIVVHDCNPPYETLARETYKSTYMKHLTWDGNNWQVDIGWCGTVWKAFYRLRHTRPDLAMWCVNDDLGVGIIQVGEQKLAPADNPFYEYNIFIRNRKEYLNLITPDEFMNIFGGVDV